MCVSHTLSLTFSIAANFIQQFVRLTQKSNCLLKTWFTKTPVSCNNSEVILLILVYISKRKDLPSVSNILWVFHSHFSWVISLKYCTIISNAQQLPSLTIYLPTWRFANTLNMDSVTNVFQGIFWKHSKQCFQRTQLARCFWFHMIVP